MTKIFLIMILSILIMSGCSTSNQLKSNNTNPEKTAENKPLQKNNLLNLSNQNLNKVPEYIFKQTFLKNLNLSNNKLTGSIPAEIRLLQNLETLDASNNQMTGVPAEIGQLKMLQVLNLSKNKLTGLPYELGNLSNLKILDISGNNYSELDLNIIQKNLPANVTIIK